jgi:hypothetical protein
MQFSKVLVFIITIKIYYYPRSKATEKKKTFCHDSLLHLEFMELYGTGANTQDQHELPLLPLEIWRLIVSFCAGLEN